MRRMLTIALVAGGLALSSTAAHAAVPSRIIPPPGLHWVGKLIKHDFRVPLGKVNYHMAMCVAQRESNFDPNAYNPSSGASGVFQFIPSTWAWASEQAGYGGASPFKARANVGTAAWVVANYGWAPWGGHCP
jgi:soluble lytic murein transglycosylase-like protein